MEEFSRAVSVGNEYEYKPSAAFASLLMSRADCDGIAYPAIKSAKLDINMALKTHSADQKLRAVAVDVVEAKKSGNGEIGVARLATSANIDASGLISCRNATGQTASLPWIDLQCRISI